MRNRKPNKLGTVSGLFIWILTVLLLASSGITYRLLASHLDLLLKTPISLPVPLSALPTQIGNWVGTELSLPSTTQEYIKENFADDFLCRRYMNNATGAWADVYIVYCSSLPASILGHRPRVCYPAHGWIHDSTEPSQIISRSGRQIPCLIHRFNKPAPTHDQKIILNFYILNGQFVTDESAFSGPFGRRPNFAGDPARYVAQVQISSVLEHSIRMAGEDMADWISNFLPDKNGRVRATELGNHITEVLE